MTNYYPLAFQLAHWYAINLRQWERENIPFEMVEFIYERGQLFTLMVDEKILAIVGYLELWAGVFEVYVYPSIYVPHYPILTIKVIRRSLDAIAKSHNMRRQQTHSLADPQTDKWMRALGFECEGTRKEYTAKREDCRAWVRFNEVSV